MSGDSAQERTEKPTPKRIRDARERGEVPRSRELAAAVGVGTGAIALLGLSAALAGGAIDWMRHALSPDVAVLREPALMGQWFGGVGFSGFKMVLPLLLAGWLAALVAPLMLGGWNISAKAITPDFGRCNPVKGIGRMFSAQALMELLKALLKSSVLGTIAVFYVLNHSGELQALGREDVVSAIAHGLKIAFGCLIWLCGGLVLIALVDAPYQVWSYIKKLRMSRQDLRDEHKQAEGSPEVKGRIRRVQQEIANRRMMEKVPTADVVVMNPTHYAVALKYEAGKMRAPRVIAKGVDLMALAIRDRAREHRVPILEAPPLARALYRGAAIDQEIPAVLYAAVAQVLTWVYQLRNKTAGKPPLIGEVPGGEVDPPSP